MTVANNAKSGESHHGSKLDWAKVREIRSSPKSDAELAVKFGVSRRTVQFVRANATWRDPDYRPRR